MLGRLTDLQARILVALAPVQPRWTLTGGAALAGFHLQHRTTRDLDLFWHGLAVFGPEPEQCIDHLEREGLTVNVLQRTTGFVRLRAELHGEAAVVDLVAEPVPNIERPQQVTAGGAMIQVDSLYEILVNKLGTLLHRAEVRDLVDLRALLDRGGDLGRALRDANKKDSGFSPIMLGHLLHGFPLERQAKIAGLDAATTAALDRFRVDLAARIAKVTQP
ncbi:MAG TPA: nucleotidyl transferase AbiEii/AbiGii toxin family protein [Planctomycetota bacterium]|nr:nucleotidyl transferase AbiEii/AbiGii toxin family protein [Planctomycetota bacterium]